MTQHSRDTPQFYVSAPSVCPYLPNRSERKVFTHLAGPNAAELHDVLAHSGFRRSQTICYKPACENCRACMSVRLRVNDFALTRTQRRIMAMNADLVGQMKPPVPSSEQFSLFRGYLDARHPDGGMADMTMLDYVQMVEETTVRTCVVEYRASALSSPLPDGGRNTLVGVALTDILSDGLSMVYAFYEPDLPRRSLGTLMILDHVARARAMDLPYLYLGYWVKGSPQMDYKARFRPLEVLDGSEWRPLTDL